MRVDGYIAPLPASSPVSATPGAISPAAGAAAIALAGAGPFGFLAGPKLPQSALRIITTTTTITHWVVTCPKEGSR